MSRMAGPRGGTVPVTVYLNVYDLHEANQYMHTFGFGAYHTGVEIAGKEYTFAGGAGIFDMPPKQAPGATYRETLVMGTLTDGPSALARALDVLKTEYGSEDYNILTRNCNHFANALCTQLLGKGIPGYLNRLAFVGSFFSCFMPRELTQEAPVNTAPGEYPSAPRSFVGVGPSGGAARPSRPLAFAGEGRSLSNVGNGAPAAGGPGGVESEAERRDRIRQATLARLATPDTPSTPDISGGVNRYNGSS